MIALYPGAYKPPHRGHFNVVKSLLDGSYNGAVYNKDNYKETGAELLKGKRENKPKVDKVIVFVGGGERNGITKEESMSIWNIYAKYLGNIEIIDGQKNPMFAAKDYAQANPEEEFVAVTGIRGEKDFVDLRRVTTFKNAPNVQGLALTSAPGSGVRATDFRNNILSGNLDKITDFFPEELSREEILNILTDLKDKIVAEILASNIEGFVEGYFKETESIKEGIKEPAPIRSIDRSRLSNLYNYLSNLIPTGTTIDLVGDKINIKYKNPIQEQQSGPQLKDYITSLTEYMLELGMNITPLPEVKLRKDEANAANFFGRTAYYDPNAREVVLYITGRHDKDIVRSYAHEMIHHMQNLQGTLHNIQTQDTNEDDKLLELEKEAYTLGNITFRNWEDGLKNNLQENLEDPKLTDQLKNYIEDYSDIDVNLLKDLLKIKSKYPNQLDPRTGGNSFGYRGTTFNKDFISKLKVKSKSNGVTEYEVPSNLKITSKGKRGFLSFSTDEEVAKGFGHYSGYVDHKKSPDRVGGYVKVSLDNPNFIIHPDYMGELSKDMEYSKESEKETLFIGNSFKPDSIFVVDKDLFKL